MSALNCYVFAWSHEGRREGLFLEATPLQRCHFVRRTRRGYVRWGSHGMWRLTLEQGLPVLSLVEFRCCSDATIRCITFTVDPHNRSFMSDTQGRTIRYLGQLRMTLYAGPQRALSMPGSEEWVLL